MSDVRYVDTAHIHTVRMWKGKVLKSTSMCCSSKSFSVCNESQVTFVFPYVFVYPARAYARARVRVCTPCYRVPKQPVPQPQGSPSRPR